MSGTETAIAPGWRTGRRLAPAVLAAPGLGAVLEALEGRAFLVGGVVRNALLGEVPGDVDLSTPLRPETVTGRLEAAGLRAVPTGIEHGTVTAVAEGIGYEVTTFRADVETDGRRAVVRFSEDMAEDAMRRDLTLNALYADAAGAVIDPLGGLGDLEARRIRFIGEPEERIREDYLRILRFFRFHALYGGGAEGPGIDADGLAACAALADGIERLARERVGHEMRKLLAAPDPAPATAAMQASGVLWRCLPGASAAPLAPLVHLEALAGRAADWHVRLAAIGGEEPEEALRLSRAEARVLERIRGALSSGLAPGASAWRHGAEAAWAAALIATAAQPGIGQPAPDWETLGAEIAAGAAARFPLAAGDLLAAGHAPGPAIGAALAEAERVWLDSGFRLDKSALLTHLGAKGQQD
ncbi:MAG: CCA tRNA nucleotidyltransferase [Pseudomonadota bacterium]